MKVETGTREKGDFKGGISESGTIAPESTDEAVAMSATQCTGHVSGDGERRSGDFSGEARIVTVNLPSAELALVAEAAEAKGLTVEQFIAAALREKLGPTTMSASDKRLRETGLLPADAPLSEWEILLDAAGTPFLVLKISKRGVRAQPWSDDTAGKQRPAVTVSHAAARAMRRAGIPRALSLGDVLVWGDKPCRVIRVPSAEDMARASRTNPPTMTVAGDWLEAGELFEEDVPYSVSDLRVRFMRFALPDERKAFERADKIREGLAFPSQTERRAMKKGRHEDQPTRDGK